MADEKWKMDVIFKKRLGRNDTMVRLAGIAG